MIETEVDPALRTERDGSRFRGHSIFEDATAESIPMQRQVTEPDWLEQARLGVEEHGRYLAFSDGGTEHVVKVGKGWTRIGRSAAADIRLDDATVSRRHALVVNDEERGLRVLDDRSLNGICLNGERIEWGELSDGDELQVGRYCLYVIDTDAAAGAA